MATYEEQDELCHQADDDPWWQESVVLTFWDEQAGLGCFFRIGHEVGQGTATAWLGAVTEDGARYRWYRPALPLEEADRKADGVRVAAAGVSVDVQDGALRWRIDRPELECDLTVTDFYPMTNLWEAGAGFSLAKEFAPQHWESSGRVSGPLRLGDRRYEIDGLHHRDHSWGTRRWNTTRTHRWVAGTVGPELSFMALSWLATDGTLVREGYVNRHGQTTLATSIDILTHVEVDGLSTRSGTVRMELADGSSLALEATAVDGILFPHRNVACVDTLSRMRTETGGVGFCDFETTHNSREGSAPVDFMLGAVTEDGLSQR